MLPRVARDRKVLQSVSSADELEIDFVALPQTVVKPRLYQGGKGEEVGAGRRLPEDESD